MTTHQIIATLLSGGSVTVTPTPLVVDPGDKVDLVVVNGSGSSAADGQPYTATITFSTVPSPLAPPNPTVTGIIGGNPESIGTVSMAAMKNNTYTITISSGASTWSEDPELEVKQ